MVGVHGAGTFKPAARASSSTIINESPQRRASSILMADTRKGIVLDDLPAAHSLSVLLQHSSFFGVSQ